MNPMSNAALNYAQKHFKIFPLNVNSKSEQVLKSWKSEATNDLQQVQNWWNQNPSYNIGLKTGNGLVVIDVDCKNGKNGMEQLKPFLATFPKTKVAKTCNDGYHLYYKVDREVRNSIALMEGIDVRGDGGYVLAPPSVVDDKSYAWVNNLPIAEANDAVYDFLSKTKNDTTKPLDDCCLIQEGKRNDYLFKMACYLQKKGFHDESIRLCITKENEKRCYPSLEMKEVNNICSSALSYDKGFIQTKRDVEYGGRFTAKELLSSDIKEEQDIVEDMIPIGLTLIGAPQKTGKTFFGLQLADAIASGKKFLGKNVRPGTSLYLAFEDHKNKIQKRLKTMKIEEKDNLVVDVLKPDNYFDLEKRIQKELEVNKDLRVVVVDTFAKMRRNKDRDYDSEYSESTLYHELAFKYNLSIILITHVKKEIDPKHPFDSIYGSRGLVAGADSIIVLYKRNFLSKNRQLAIQGKDFPEEELTICQNEMCIFEIVENDFDEQIDENLSKVINFIVRNKIYEGSHESLCSKLSLKLRGKGLQILLTKNKDFLKDSFITYEILPRTNKARLMRLVYDGDEET